MNTFGIIISMKVFAISDLHLSFSTNKPMDVFGGNWEGYWEKIKKDWQDKVSDDDVVLLAGDLSWAINLDEVKADIEELNKCKGKKIIVKGNHDYWWSTLSKVKKVMPDNISLLQNNCIRVGKLLVCGSRLWTLAVEDKEDIKIADRECIRLEMSLQEMEKERKEGDYVVVMCHYPPFEPNLKDGKFTEIIKKHKIDCVVYGHLHGKSSSLNVVNKGGIPYFLTSCDKLNNTLLEITQIED